MQLNALIEQQLKNVKENICVFYVNISAEARSFSSGEWYIKFCGSLFSPVKDCRDFFVSPLIVFKMRD